MVTKRNTGKRTGGSPAVEDYLEQIYNLIQAKGYARVIDIAKGLEISQASVTNMVQRMDGEGFVVYEKYRGMTLTEAGEQIAQAVIRRHEVLTRLLKPFDIDRDTRYRDVEGMEHHVSSATLKVFSALADELEANPDLVKHLQKRANDL